MTCLQPAVELVYTERPEKNAQSLMPVPATFSMVSWQKKSLQQANITKLTKTMLNASTLRTNDQQQSFRPLVNSSIVD